MKNEIMVSICMATYNHEKYIRQALDSIVNQKTNFKFELLVHDDASTDKTPGIIKEYEEKYPDIVKPIYQTENQYSKGVKISFVYNYPRISGKYTAFLEGDDFYLDENKLQEQFDIMEKNQSCSLCTHKVVVKNEDLTVDTGFHPNIDLKEGMHNADDILKIYLGKINYMFQTSSYFAKSEIIKKLLNEMPEFVSNSPVGDFPLMLYFAISGDIYYIDKVMSVYRRGSIGSWTMGQKDNKTANKFYFNLSKMLDEFDKYTDNKYNEYSEKTKHFCYYSIAYNNNDYKSLKKEYSDLFKKVPFKRRVKKLVLWLLKR